MIFVLDSVFPITGTGYFFGETEFVAFSEYTFGNVQRLISSVFETGLFVQRLILFDDCLIELNNDSILEEVDMLSLFKQSQ